MRVIKKKNILLTGDDSVRAEGLILVKRIVEKFADFEIVGTKDQMSAKGCAFNLSGGKWGTEQVDNLQVHWVEGYPSDAVYFALEKFSEKPFDLVVSGVNYGLNLDNATMIRSGTVAAAITASVSRGIPAIAFSMEVESEKWLMNHTSEFDRELMKYPGNFVEKIINHALNYNFDEGEFWNINIPTTAKNIRVAKTSKVPIYPNNQLIEDNTYNYALNENHDQDPDTDAALLRAGYVTVTSCKLNFTNHDKLDDLKAIFYE